MNHAMLARCHNANFMQGQRINATGLTIKFCFCKRTKYMMVQVIKQFLWSPHTYSHTYYVFIRDRRKGRKGGFPPMFKDTLNNMYGK